MKQHEPRPVDPVNTPLEINCIDDEIVIIGPGSVAFSMTIEAAKETSLRLAHALVQCGGE